MAIGEELEGDKSETGSGNMVSQLVLAFHISCQKQEKEDREKSKETNLFDDAGMCYASVSNTLSHSLSEEEVLPSEGASRSVGGIIRGQATGNTFSFADDSELMSDRIQAQGLVKVYKSCIDAIGEVKPNLVVKTDVTASLGPILKKVSKMYSPVSSKSFIKSQFYIHII